MNQQDAVARWLKEIDRASAELLAAVSSLRDLDEEVFPRDIAQAALDRTGQA